MEELSSRQADILNEWNTTDNNILINSVAGSGKSTTLLNLLKASEHRTLIIAFNKSIQIELQTKIDELGLRQGKALTLHSLGLSAIKTSVRRWKIEKNKNWDLARQVQAKYKRQLSRVDFNEKIKISFTLNDLNDCSRMNLTDDFDEIKALLLTMDKDIVDSVLVRSMWEDLLLFREDSYTAPIVNIDFLDMIYLPVKLGLEIPISTYYLFMDECQDFNKCQHKLLDTVIQQTVKKWVAVGDRNQAIYGFSGANAKSFDLFLEKPGTTVEMPLDICYRSDRKIIEEANKVYDVMVPYSQEEGIVGHITNPELIKPNSMVVCRNSSPLIELYFTLLSLNRRCYINGNEIMDFLLKFLRPYSKDTIKSAKIEMVYKYGELLENTATDEAKYRAAYFFENYKNFCTISDHLSTENEPVEDFIIKLKDLFKVSEDSIMLCTIHKSKGLQRDVVYILNEHLIPSKFAKSPEQLVQEQNLKYVARTRAKHEMYYLDIKNKK